MEEKSKLICNKCNVELVPAETTFSYLGRQFRHEVPRCPSCGQVYIPPELAAGRMADVERALEDK